MFENAGCPFDCLARFPSYYFLDKSYLNKYHDCLEKETMIVNCENGLPF